MSGKAIVRLGDSQESWDSLGESTQNRSETLRNLIELADSDRLKAIQEDLDVSTPEDALETLVGGYALPGETGNPFSDYDPETFIGTLTTGKLRELKNMDEEVVINPDHVDSMPAAIEDKVEVVIAILRWEGDRIGVDEDMIEEAVKQYLGDSPYYLTTKNNGVDAPNKIKARLHENFMNDGKYFLYEEEFARFANVHVETFEEDVVEAMESMRDDKNGVGFKVRRAWNEDLVGDVVSKSNAILRSVERYPELVDADVDRINLLRDAVVEYYNSKGETDLLVEEGVDLDSISE